MGTEQALDSQMSPAETERIVESRRMQLGQCPIHGVPMVDTVPRRIVEKVIKRCSDLFCEYTKG